MGNGYKFEDLRKIGKMGRYSYNVTISKAILRSLGWRSRQRVVEAQQGDTIVIRDWKPEDRKQE